MKVAVIGSGKTGGHLLKLLPPEKLIGPFGRTHPVTVKDLNQADVAILFIPGEAFLSLVPTLLESKTPLVIGATGFEWSDALKSEIKKRQLHWLHATNFSLGIQLFRQLIKSVNRLQKSIPSFQAELLDIHHTKKLDSPSGTAKSLASWCDFPVSIDARREGDVVGFHELTLKFAQETIKISHDAHDRSLFAQGAIDVAGEWIKKPLPAGLHGIEDLMDHLEKNA
jgi:4-hydroxy-tetrahydrodipicolinate reductase